MITETFYRVQCRPLAKDLRASWQFWEFCPDEHSARQLAKELNNSRERLQEYRAVKIETQTTTTILES